MSRSVASAHVVIAASGLFISCATPAAHAVVVDDDAVWDRVEGLLPDSLGRAERVQESRVVERERSHLREPFQLLSLFGGEAVVVAVADGQHAEALAARAQTHQREVAQAFGAVQRKLARGKVARDAANLYEVLVLEGRDALCELAAQGVCGLTGRRVRALKAARREPSYRPVFDGEARDARGVGAQYATHGRHDGRERRRAVRLRRAPAPEVERAGRARASVRRPAPLGLNPVFAFRHHSPYLARIAPRKGVQKSECGVMS